MDSPAFLGASSAFIESTLWLIFKRVENNEYRGGPAIILNMVLVVNLVKFTELSLQLMIISVGLLLPGVQSNAIASSMHNAIQFHNG
ncbi:alanine:cation symporter family protein [Staphylococcus aureus]